MAFIKGFRATNGILTNEVWEFAAIDVTDYDWNTPPGNDNSGFCEIGSGYMGAPDGGSMGSAKFNVPSINYSGWETEFLLASFEIQGSQGSDYKRELRFTTAGNFSNFGPQAYTGNVGIKAYVRIYSDPTTYVDTLISPDREIQFHRNDFSGVYSLNTYCVFANVMYNGHHKVLIGISNEQNSGLNIHWTGQYTYFDYNYFWQLLGGNVPEEEFSPEFGPGEEPEGYTGGSFDYSSDEIDMPSKPQSVLSLGFVNVYKCAANALTDFGAALFPEIHWPSDLTEVGEVLAALSDSIWNSKLIDYVVSVHCIPGDVPAGNLEDIKVGARTMTGILARKITNEYVDFDFQSIHTADIYKNFMDVMCEAQLFLPFYGFINLKPEHWNGGDIAVKYRFNMIDGSFMAYVFSKPNKSEMTSPGLIGQYGGSAVVHLPVSSMSYASMFSGMIGGAATALGGAMSGSITTAISGAATVGASSGGDAKMSNSYNASASFMTRRRPFLLISAPVPAFSTRYAVENGLPSNSVFTLGQCRGFTQAENAILDGIPCTVDEKKRIEEYLKSGVIIKPIN